MHDIVNAMFQTINEKTIKLMSTCDASFIFIQLQVYNFTQLIYNPILFVYITKNASIK